MLRILGRRSVRRSVRRGRREAVRTVRVRKGEMSTSPPEKLTKHLLPCHVRLLDGTDLYCQLPVSCSISDRSYTIILNMSYDQYRTSHATNRKHPLLPITSREHVNDVLQLDFQLQG